MKTFDLPSNSNYGDQPIPIAFPDNWDVHISKIHGYDTPALTEAQIAEKIHAAIGRQAHLRGRRRQEERRHHHRRHHPPDAVRADRQGRHRGAARRRRAEGEHLVHHRARHPRCHVPHGVRAQARRGGSSKLRGAQHNLFFNHVFVGNTTNNVPSRSMPTSCPPTTRSHRHDHGPQLLRLQRRRQCILPGVSSLRTTCATTASRRRRSSTWATPTRSCAATPSRPRA